MVRLQREGCALLVIDVQERLLPVIHTAKEIERRVSAAVSGARILGLPVLATEQYPKGLGRTTGPVAAALKGITPIEKSRFSCCGVGGIDGTLADLEPKTILIAGIETHVCVLQTCLDLLERRITPVLLADCAGTRHPHDHQVAVERIRDAGALVTTLESALFELLEVAGTEEFKRISGLIKSL